jgi:hypothetical protein
MSQNISQEAVRITNQTVLLFFSLFHSIFRLTDMKSSPSYNDCPFIKNLIPNGVIVIQIVKT